MTEKSHRALDPLVFVPENLTDKVYSAIRDAIIEQRLAPGTRISEAGLAEQLEVSKTPVREAILKLSEVGLIENSGRGTRVLTSSPGRLREAYEWREGVETQSARLASENHTPREMELINDSAERCLSRAEHEDQEGFRRLDREFHEHVANASHNPLIWRHFIGAYDLTWTLRLRESSSGGFMVSCGEQHIGIAHAIAEGNTDHAEKLMRTHIQTVRDKVTAVSAP